MSVLLLLYCNDVDTRWVRWYLVRRYYIIIYIYKKKNYNILKRCSKEQDKTRARMRSKPVCFVCIIMKTVFFHEEKKYIL